MFSNATCPASFFAPLSIHSAICSTRLRGNDCPFVYGGRAFGISGSANGEILVSTLFICCIRWLHFELYGITSAPNSEPLNIKASQPDMSNPDCLSTEL